MGYIIFPLDCTTLENTGSDIFNKFFLVLDKGEMKMEEKI